MSIDLRPTYPVPRRFADDPKLNAKSLRTQQSYCRAPRKLTEYLGHPLDQATREQLRRTNCGSVLDCLGIRPVEGGFHTMES